MSTGNLIRLRECLIQLHLPAFREHYAAQAALATKESLSYPRFLLSLSELKLDLPPPSEQERNPLILRPFERT